MLVLASGRYYTLSEVGGRIWSRLCDGEPADRISSGIGSQYAVPIAEIEDDVNRFITSLAENAIIEPKDWRVRGREPRPPTAVRSEGNPRRGASDSQPHEGLRSHPLPLLASCLIRLAIVDVSLRAFGLEKVLRRIERVSRARLACSVPLAWHRKAAARVEAAAAWYPFRAQCLERSLCLLWLARRAGSDAALVIGVQAYPFKAHAWVEHGSEPVNTSPERLALYERMPSLELERA